MSEEPDWPEGIDYDRASGVVQPSPREAFADPLEEPWAAPSLEEVLAVVARGLSGRAASTGAPIAFTTSDGVRCVISIEDRSADTRG